MVQSTYLQEFQQKVGRKKEITHVLKELYLQKEELLVSVEKLGEVKQAEQKDVDRLEKNGVTSLFYSVIGKKDAKLEKLAECEKEWKQLLEEKRKQIENSKAPEKEKMFTLEKQLMDAKKVQSVILETKDIGEEIRKNIEIINGSLEKAEASAVKESFGRLSMEMDKYQQLGKVQEQASKLQKQLEKYKLNMENIAEENYDMNVFYELGNGLSAFHMQSDMAMEVAIIERIRAAKAVVRQIEQETKNSLEQLELQQKQNEKELEKVTMQLENFIVTAFI